MQVMFFKTKNFQCYKKEYDLLQKVKLRVKKGKFHLDKKYLDDIVEFVKLIRTLKNYDLWLQTKHIYSLQQSNEELYFLKGKFIRPCAKINKFTKKVEYFLSVADLVEDMGYDITWVYKHLSKDRTLDGFYLCYENEVDEILERL